MGRDPDELLSVTGGSKGRGDLRRAEPGPEGLGFALVAPEGDDAGRIRLRRIGQEDAPALGHEAIDQKLPLPEQFRRDGVDADLVDELQSRVKSRDAEDVQGTGLVTPCPGAELQTRLRDVVGAFEIRPAMHERFEHLLAVLPYIENAGGEGAEKPLVGVGREKIDVPGRRGERPEGLDAIHREENPALTQEAADGVQFYPPARDEMTRGQRHQPCAFIDLPEDVYRPDASELFDVEEPDLHAALRQRHPRVDVRREVVVVDDDVLALPEVQAAGDEAQAQRRRSDEGDFIRLRPEELRREIAGFTDEPAGNLLLLVAVRAGRRVGLDGLGHTARQRADGGVRKEGGILHHGKLVPPQLFVRQDLGKRHDGA